MVAGEKAAVGDRRQRGPRDRTRECERAKKQRAEQKKSTRTYRGGSTILIHHVCPNSVISATMQQSIDDLPERREDNASKVVQLGQDLLIAQRTVDDLKKRLAEAADRIAEAAGLAVRVEAMRAELDRATVRLAEYEADLVQERRWRLLAEGARNEALARAGSRRYPIM